MNKSLKWFRKCVYIISLIINTRAMNIHEYANLHMPPHPPTMPNTLILLT